MRLRVSAKKRLGDFYFDAEFECDSPILGVFGPSGHGKTTLLNLLAGLERPDSGEIIVGGERFSGPAGTLPPRERGLGFIFQQPRLFPHLDVRGNLLYGRKRSSEAAIGFDEVVGLLELESLLDRRPGRLSGGEAQRVAIGRALLRGPKLLLLDEPFSGLDYRLKDRIVAYLKEIHKVFSVPMILVSHSLPDILRLTRQVVVLRDGRVEACGDIYEALDRSLVYRLLRREGFVNVVEGVVAGRSESGLGTVVFGGRRVLARLDGISDGARVLVQIPARDILLSRKRVTELSARNAIPGTITRAVRLGDVVLCHIDAGEELVAEITPEAQDALELKAGSEIFCIVKTQSITLSAL
ncbi:MAG: molybdenum ABC transporter ATP-binding protein [Elusimicrobiota bacterium]